MKKLNVTGLFCTLALSLATLTACSDDPNESDPAPTPTPEENPILFKAEDGTTTQIGDGNQTFEITGKQTLPKGTYYLKGWCYVTDGAELTIEAGTVIKGDKETKAALIVEPGGKLFAKGTAEAPIVMTSEQ